MNYCHRLCFAWHGEFIFFMWISIHGCHDHMCYWHLLNCLFYSHYLKGTIVRNTCNKNKQLSILHDSVCLIKWRDILVFYPAANMNKTKSVWATRVALAMRVWCFSVLSPNTLSRFNDIFFFFWGFFFGGGGGFSKSVSPH